MGEIINVEIRKRRQDTIKYILELACLSLPSTMHLLTAQQIMNDVQPVCWGEKKNTAMDWYN